VEQELKRLGAKIYRSNRELDTYQKGLRIAEYDDFIKQRRRPKPYEALDHDIVVWTDVEALRTKSSPVLQAGALLVTTDYYFYRFAWLRLRARSEVGAVVLPSQLIQLLRPFIASTDDFDRRFVETFALPEMRALPVDYSPVTGTVLGYLNALADMNEKSALKILTNKMLFDELRGVDLHSAKFRETIDNAIARENVVLLEERDAAVRRADESERLRDDALSGQRVALEAAERAERESSTATTAAEQRARQAELQADSARQRAQQLEEEVRRARAAQAALGASKTRLWWAMWCVVFIVGAGVILLLPSQVIHWQWLDKHPNRLGLYGGALVAWAGICWGFADEHHRWVGAAGLVIAIVAATVALLGK